jgi:hypothetical protein
MQKAKCIWCNVEILQSTFDNKEGLCAPCYKKKSEEESHTKFMLTPGCPACDEQKYLSFRWQAITNNDKNHKYQKYIKPIKTLKYGTLYNCIICNKNWWLNDKSHTIYFIQDNHLSLLNEWNKNEYGIPKPLLEELLKIGATPPDIYGNRLNYIVIPCSVTTTDGNHYAKSLIKITNLPPIFNAQKNSTHILFSNKIKDIKPSPFALPLQVRKATAMAEEIRTGFSPTIVATYNKKHFVLNGITDFFDYKDIKGEEVFLPNKNNTEEHTEYYECNNNEEIYYFYSDLSWYQKILSDFLAKLDKEFLLKVEDRFEITNQGLYLAPTIPYNYSKQQNVQVLLKKPNGELQITPAYIFYPFLTPTPKEKTLTCQLPETTKDDVPIGTEVWILRQ